MLDVMIMYSINTGSPPLSQLYRRRCADMLLSGLLTRYELVTTIPSVYMLIILLICYFSFGLKGLQSAVLALRKCSIEHDA